jgi:hypothetical protein
MFSDPKCSKEWVEAAGEDDGHDEWTGIPRTVSVEIAAPKSLVKVDAPVMEWERFRLLPRRLSLGSEVQAASLSVENSSKRVTRAVAVDAVISHVTDICDGFPDCLVL